MELNFDEKAPDWSPEKGEECIWIHAYSYRGIKPPPERVTVVGTLGHLFRVKTSSGRRQYVTLNNLARLIK